MKKQIKIYFSDFWPDFDMNHNFISDILSVDYEISLDKNPDYLFFSSFGQNHLKWNNCIKVYFTGENDVPDFNLCDYAMGFHHISFEDRYLRYPLYVLYNGFQELSVKRIEKEEVLNRKFCNFIYSNNKWADPIREKFFHQLSRYKKIDSGGACLNNIGKRVGDKISFIKDYKFTIAFENSCVSGYTTEKISEPMRVNSLPIYWGNPKVELDFNKHSFICVADFNTIDESIEEIIRLDNDDNAYLEKLSQPWLQEKNFDDWQNELKVFLFNILKQPLVAAKRTTCYGFTQRYMARQKKLSGLGMLSKFIKS